jgi:hypothetical protein
MKKYISIITAVILAIGISGCKKDFLSLEANPNLPSQTTPQLILAGAIVTVPNITISYLNPYDVWSGYLSWNGGVVPPSTLFQYTFTNGTYGNFWTELYSNATNFNNLITLASKDASLSHFQAIAMIMKAWDFQNLVDNYGDVPYSQAFQPSTILFPKYDKAADIYADIYKQLDAAIAVAGKDGISPGASDPMFGGDMAKWVQTANTLKLRIALRESNLATGTTPPPFATTLPASGDGYLTTDALINPGYANTAGQQNPFYGNFVLDATGNPAANSNVYRANAFSVKYLQNTDDTLRLSRIFSLAAPVGSPAGTKPSVYYGNVYGDAVGIQGTANVSGAGPAFSKGATQSSIFILASESYLQQAEAVERKWIAGDASALYVKGIEADFNYLGLSKDDADTYAAANPITKNSNPIQNIIDQEWVTFLNGYDSFEAFNNYRRTGYPNLPSSVDPAAISNHLPTRLYYPSSEQTANPDNYVTVDPFTTKIFWAK